MRYKIVNKDSPARINSTGKNYTIKKTEDVVRLRFDEVNQAFYAKIENPSQHTRYLFENNKLAIALCKMNCGKETLHGHFCKHQSYITPTGDERDDPSSFVKRNRHPRWSRCHYSFIPVQDLNAEIELGYDNDWLKPNPGHTVNGGNWYNSIKAVLLSSMIDLSDYYSENDRIIFSSRAYRTMCNRIKIEYDSDNEIIIHRRKHESIDPYGISVTVTQNDRELTFNITSMSSKVLQAFKNNDLWIGLDFQDISYATNHGGNNKRAHNGDHWEEKEPGTENYDSRRYEYRLQDKWYCSQYMRRIIDYSDTDTLTITYTVPAAVNTNAIPGSGIRNLLVLMHKHNDVQELDLVHRMPRVVIGMTESSAGRRLFKYSPNLIVDFT